MFFKFFRKKNTDVDSIENKSVKLAWDEKGLKVSGQGGEEISIPYFDLISCDLSDGKSVAVKFFLRIEIGLNL